MMDKTGGPAFPVTDECSGMLGMTLRDYFAAKAMQGLLVSFPGESMQREVITDSYKLADAMLEARK